MASKELLDYVKKELSEGFSLDQIKGVLIKNGYSKEEALEATRQEHHLDLTKLVTYFKIELSRGFRPEQIKQGLLRAGYTSEDVETVVKALEKIDDEDLLCHYTQKKLNQGYSMEQIKDVLLRRGHKENHVDEALMKSKVPSIEPRVPNKFNVVVKISLALLVLVLVFSLYESVVHYPMGKAYLKISVCLIYTYLMSGVVYGFSPRVKLDTNYGVSLLIGFSLGLFIMASLFLEPYLLLGMLVPFYFIYCLFIKQIYYVAFNKAMLITVLLFIASVLVFFASILLLGFIIVAFKIVPGVIA